MTLPRKQIVSIDDTPFYHCVSRCVRRAFLCGFDRFTARSYEHRRAWLEHKLHHTAELFAVKLCAYAVMSNHYHVVLHVRPDIAANWSYRDVIERWSSLFNGTLFSQRFLKGKPLDDAQWKVLKRDIKRWRERLTDISWFMRIVNESIARQANAEDRCTGRFWEGRFKSQALLDEQALLSCMAYVDLNPIRAKMADTPETSDHTSIKARIDVIKDESKSINCLEDFVGIQQNEIGIPFRLKDYVELVDWTGRIIREDKRGHIASDLPPIIKRLGLDSSIWQRLTTEFETRFQTWVSRAHIHRRIGQSTILTHATLDPPV